MLRWLDRFIIGKTEIEDYRKHGRLTWRGGAVTWLRLHAFLLLFCVPWVLLLHWLKDVLAAQ